MRQGQRLEPRRYRRFDIEIIDDGGTGWAVVIREPDSTDRHALRNRMPNGLEVLIEEARAHIDRRIDGTSRI
jgi:hypothetical protein